MEEYDGTGWWIEELNSEFWKLKRFQDWRILELFLCSLPHTLHSFQTPYPTKSHCFGSKFHLLGIFHWWYFELIFRANDRSFYLFFNKYDVFESRLEEIPLKTCFPEYCGKNAAHESFHYVRKQFLKIARAHPMKNKVDRISGIHYLRYHLRYFLNFVCRHVCFRQLFGLTWK